MKYIAAVQVAKFIRVGKGDINGSCARSEIKGAYKDGFRWMKVFIDFLTKLRSYYNNRSRYASFHSVILAGVGDMKNIKRKVRSAKEPMDNSPWNIAADFDIEMSFSPEDIRQTLHEYEPDHRTGINEMAVAQEIFDDSAGYPYLVSRIYPLLDLPYSKAGRKDAWTYTEILDALHTLVGAMYDFLKNAQGQAAISNRIFEIWFYQLFTSQEAIRSSTNKAGERNKNRWIQNGRLDMELVLKKS